VAGALAMMARWDLDALQAALPRLAVPLHQIVGERDRTVPPANAGRVQQPLAPAAKGTLTVLPGLGHLAHEERPQAVVELLLGMPGLLERPALGGACVPRAAPRRHG
jgi:magnesium chelatase accessory protein